VGTALRNCNSVGTALRNCNSVGTALRNCNSVGTALRNCNSVGTALRNCKLHSSLRLEEVMNPLAPVLSVMFCLLVCYLETKYPKL